MNRIRKRLLKSRASLLVPILFLLAFATVLTGFISQTETAYAAPQCFARGSDGITVPIACSDSVFEEAGGRDENGCYVTIIAGYAANSIKVDCATVAGVQQQQPPICYTTASHGYQRAPCSHPLFASQNLQNGKCYVGVVISGGAGVREVPCGQAQIQAVAQQQHEAEQERQEREEQQAATEETADTDEVEPLTEEEIAAQAEQLREDLSKGTNECGESKTVFDFGCCTQAEADDGECEFVENPILAVLFAVITFVTYGIGIIITLAIVISGIQYATAQGDPGTVKKARTRIFNAVVALLLYLFSFAILNYLVPGGLIG